jgi:hypothetical protein
MDLVPQVPETHRATKHTTLALLSAPKERFHLANWYGGLFCKYEPHWIEQKTNSFALLNVMLVLTIPCTATESRNEQKTNSFALLNVMLVLTIPCTATESRNDATTSGGGISHVRASTCSM